MSCLRLTKRTRHFVRLSFVTAVAGTSEPLHICLIVTTQETPC